MSVVYTRAFEAPPFNKREILRYAGCKSSDSAIVQLMDDAIREVEVKLTYNVCFCSVPLAVKDDICDFGSFCLTSSKLAKNLMGCERALLFGATVGVGIDRLISKYGLVAPSKAVMLQAIGAERIEALCDRFCAEYALENKVKLRPRYSAGYGDLGLEAQKDIFSLLECHKKIGLTLTDSLLMAPSKSVTAIVGIEE